VTELIAALHVQREAARVQRRQIMQTLMQAAVAKLLDWIELYLNARQPDEPATTSDRSSFVS
jgi:hypothetical protein